MSNLQKSYVFHNGQIVPRITGGKGGKGGGGGGGGISEDPNSLFSTDILFVTVGLGEGPVYRINPNGPQDIEIQDGAIDDLILLDGDGSEDTDKFKTLSSTGTTVQAPLPVFGEAIVSPQNFKSPVTLKKGNIDGIPQSRVLLQDTSQNDWDALKFLFTLNGLQKTENSGNIKGHSVTVKITVFDRIGTTEIASTEKTIDGKTNTAFKFSVKLEIPAASKSTDGYKFTIEKTSSDSESSLIIENIQSIGWFEIENSPQSYPRTAHIGYAIKATSEHQGGIPNFTSMVKGLIVKVPSNYNQPTLSSGEIDWRHIEVPESKRTTNGYYLQQAGLPILTASGNGATTDIQGQGIDISIGTGTSYYTSFSTTITQANSGFSGNQTSGNWNVIRENAGSGTGTWTASILDASVNLSGSILGKDLTITKNGVKVVGLTASTVAKGYGPVECDPGDVIVWTCSGGIGGGGTINRSQSWAWSGSGYTIGYTTNTNGGGSGTANSQTITLTNNNASNLDIELQPSGTTGITTETVVEDGDSVNLRSALSSTDDAWQVSFAVLPAGVTSATVKKEADPQIYVGTWDGTFVYSWTQNPAWIIYDILTNQTYGLGVPEENIDKYKFYQVAQYCDACDALTGKFIGVKGQSDGSFRHKPKDEFTSIRETLVGLPNGTVVDERRFVCNTVVSDQEQSMDLLNTITGAFRGSLVYSLGKLSLAIDMPEEYPSMIFNETNIETGTFQISGNKESDILTGVDVSYVEPTNHFKRETVRIDTVDANDGTDRNTVENIASLDLPTVTRRSEALRFAQYQIAASRYQRRTINFNTSTDALSLSPGDVVSVSQNMSGLNFGFGGKVASNSITTADKANVLLEHFTEPTLANTTFTANSDPLALRIISMDDDRIDLYILSNTAFTLTKTDNVGSGFDLANVSVVARFNPITKDLDDYTTFTSNNVPKKGDLWSIGEWVNPNDFYTSKAGKLFKVTDISRDPDQEKIVVGAIEYISNIYVDSDTFIDYTPTAYTDIISPLSTPPVPTLNFRAVPRRQYDGSIVTDGIVEVTTEREDYTQSIKNEFFIARPDDATIVDNAYLGSPLNIVVNNADVTANGEVAQLIGKNGFSGFIGELRLLCTDVSAVDSSSNIEFTVRGLNDAFDENFHKHILDVNDSSFLGLKGDDALRFPVNEKASQAGRRNFVAFGGVESELSSNIVDFDASNNTIKIENITTANQTLFDRTLSAPFFVKIDQLLDSRYYDNISFYVTGTEQTFIETGNINTSLATQTIELPVKAEDKNFLRFSVDGLDKSAGQFTYNKNDSLSVNANIQYSTSPSDTSFRVEVDHYTVPTIEVGDNVITSFNNVFSVVNTSYDTSSDEYNVAATSNTIYRVYLDREPVNNLAGFQFTNISQNPSGSLGNVIDSNATFNYDTSAFPGSFNLANHKLYTLTTGSDFERFSMPEDRVIKDLDLGITSLRVRNRNTMGRFSPFIEKSVTVEELPIQKVQGVAITESLYREQTGGVAVRVTISFNHIVGQEVTDYEISYKLDAVEDVGTNDGGADLTSFNTVKIPATGVDDDGKIRFTVNGINRGITSGSNFITFRVTPLNKNLRGITSIQSSAIIGKTAPPLNVFNFGGGQSALNITLFWEYERTNDELTDLDLKEVVIRRLQGTQSASVENFINGVPFVTVASGVSTKTLPIDAFGTFTYLARTRDTSGNFSNDVQAVTITTTRPKSSTVVQAYNEDDPSTDFTDIVNTNTDETFFPSFANSNTGGLAIHALPTSLVDNANGTSTGFSAVAGASTDLLADSSATYFTQVRDFGQEVEGFINIDIEGTQSIQSTYFDQQETIYSSTIDASPSNVLVDDSFGGIGHNLGFGNTIVTNFRFDSNNQTLMSGGVSGNVYAISLPGNFTDDESNANAFALVAGTINANAIELGETFFANGVSTGGNTLANLQVAGTSYALVSLNQYNDFGGTDTFVGSIGALTTQTFIRTSTADSDTMFFANGNVNVAAFVGSSINDGFRAYTAGSRTFQHFQIKYVITNSKPDEFDFTIDKFRYTIEKNQVIFTDTVTYDSSPKLFDYSAQGYSSRPTIQIQPIGTATAQTAVVTAGNASNASFQLYDIENNAVVPTDQSVQVQVTVTGV